MKTLRISDETHRKLIDEVLEKYDEWLEEKEAHEKALRRKR
jgi:hypothetical protein